MAISHSPIWKHYWKWRWAMNRPLKWWSNNNENWIWKLTNGHLTFPARSGSWRQTTIVVWIPAAVFLVVRQVVPLARRYVVWQASFGSEEAACLLFLPEKRKYFYKLYHNFWTKCPNHKILWPLTLQLTYLTMVKSLKSNSNIRTAGSECTRSLLTLTEDMESTVSNLVGLHTIISTLVSPIGW